MAELTAEIVRNIVKEEISGLRNEMHQEFTNVRSEMKGGFESVLNTMQEFHDEIKDELVGVNARMRDHNRRIANLERLSNPRKIATKDRPYGRPFERCQLLGC